MSFRVKKPKNLKKPQFTYENFFHVLPRAGDPSAKILPIVVIYSAAVEKTAKKSHLDPQNGPSKWPGQSTICEYLLYSTHSIRVAELGHPKLHTLRPNRQNVHRPEDFPPYYTQKNTSLELRGQKFEKPQKTSIYI